MLFENCNILIVIIINFDTSAIMQKWLIFPKHSYLETKLKSIKLLQDPL